MKHHRPPGHRHPRAQRVRSLLTVLATVGAVLGTILAGTPITASPANAWEAVGSSCGTYPANTTVSVEMDDVPASYAPSLRRAIAAWNSWAAVTGIAVQAVNRPVPAGTVDVNVVAVASLPDDSDEFASMRPACSSNRGLISGVLTIVRDTLGGQSERLRQNTFTHEIGHLLGLGHTSNQLKCSTVMESHISEWDQCQDSFGPYPDDIAGVLALWKPSLTPGFPARSHLGRANYPPNTGLVSSYARTSGRLNPLSFGTTGTDAYSDWTFVPDRDGWGWVVNGGSGLCLRQRGGSVSMDYCRSDDAKWAPAPAIDPGYLGTRLKNKVSGACLGGISEYDPLSPYRASMMSCRTNSWDHNTSVLEIAPSTTTRSKRSIPDAIAKGSPIIGTASNRCVTVTGASHTPGAGLSLRGCESTAQQQWTLQQASGGYTLVVYRSEEDRTGDSAQFASPELCAEGSGGSVALATCSGSTAQTWTLNRNGSIRNAGTGTCLSTSGGATTDGTPLVLWSCAAAANEIWTIPESLRTSVMSLVDPVGSTGAAIGTAPAPTGDSDQRLRAVLSNDPTSAQTDWAFVDVPGTKGGVLRNLATDTCLRWKASGQQAVLDSACNGADATYRWSSTPLPSGEWTLQNQSTGECLDASGSNTAPGTPILTWSCVGSANERWQAVANPLAPEADVAVNRVPANPAMFGVASQSSTWNGQGDAAKAIDGNPDGSWADGSVTHTRSQQGAWWQVDLGSVLPVNTVILYNRTDCCSDRLSDFWVLASSTPFPDTGNAADLAQQPGVVGAYVSSTGGQNVVWAPGGDFRYIRVQLAGTNFLSLSEVVVTQRR